MKIFKEFVEGTTDGGFEKYVASILSNLGYKCDLTPRSSDGGIDIFAYDVMGCKYGVQCKNWDNQVGIDDIAKTLGAGNTFNCNATIVMTTSTFSSGAKKFALSNNIKLIDGVGVEDLAKQTPAAINARVEEIRKREKELDVLEYQLDNREVELDNREIELNNYRTQLDSERESMNISIHYEKFMCSERLKAVKSLEAELDRQIESNIRLKSVLDAKEAELADSEKELNHLKSSFNNALDNIKNTEAKKSFWGRLCLISFIISTFITIITIQMVSSETLTDTMICVWFGIHCVLIFSLISFLINILKYNKARKFAR